MLIKKKGYFSHLSSISPNPQPQLMGIYFYLEFVILSLLPLKFLSLSNKLMGDNKKVYNLFVTLISDDGTRFFYVKKKIETLITN